MPPRRTGSVFLTKNGVSYEKPRKLSERLNGSQSLVTPAVKAAATTAVEAIAKGIANFVAGQTIQKNSESKGKCQTPPPSRMHTPKPDSTSHSGTRSSGSGASLSESARLRLWSRLLLRVRKAQVAEQLAWQQAVEEYYAQEEANKAEAEAWRQTWMDEHRAANTASDPNKPSISEVEKDLDNQRRRDRH